MIHKMRSLQFFIQLHLRSNTSLVPRVGVEPTLGGFVLELKGRRFSGRAEAENSPVRACEAPAVGQPCELSTVGWI